MTKRTKIILIVVAIIAVVVILYFVFKPKKIAVETVEIINGQPVKTVIKVNPTDGFPFKQNAAGPNVLTLQKALNVISKDPQIAVDGIFGDETYNKLLLTVPAHLSAMPVTESNLNEIKRMANF